MEGTTATAQSLAGESASQHTPGPWGENGFGQIVYLGLNDDIYRTGECLASGPDYGPVFVNPADRTLAAAAPALLEALKAVAAGSFDTSSARDYAEADPDGLARYYPEYAAVLAAIAKAEGRDV